MFNNKPCICNRCYDKDIISKKLLIPSKYYKCFLCKENIFFYSNLYIKNNNIKKEIILNKKNNNKECCYSICESRIEEFEKTSILICCKCILENDKININNYNVVKPDIMCMMCNYSLCSEYNFHNKCYNDFILNLKENY